MPLNVLRSNYYLFYAIQGTKASTTPLLLVFSRENYQNNNLTWINIVKVTLKIQGAAAVVDFLSNETTNRNIPVSCYTVQAPRSKYKYCSS